MNQENKEVKSKCCVSCYSSHPASKGCVDTECKCHTPQSLEEKGKHQISQERIHEIYKEIKEREEKQNPPTDSNWDNGELTFDYIRSIVDICNVKDVEIQSESVTVSFVPKNATGDSWKLLQEKILQLTKK